MMTASRRNQATTIVIMAYWSAVQIGAGPNTPKG